MSMDVQQFINCLIHLGTTPKMRADFESGEIIYAELSSDPDFDHVGDRLGHLSGEVYRRQWHQDALL
jgi:hypothetical protein